MPINIPRIVYTVVRAKNSPTIWPVPMVQRDRIASGRAAPVREPVAPSKAQKRPAAGTKLSILCSSKSLA